MTIKVDNGELTSSINFNWQITADPWESINVIRNRLIVLVKHNEDLPTQHFQGSKWSQRWLNKKSLSIDLSKAIYDCLRGRPKEAISKLKALLRSLDQKMLVDSERKLLKQKVNEEIPHLTALINEKF